MIHALVEEVPFNHPLGPTLISLLVKKAPMQAKYDSNGRFTVGVDTYLRVLRMTPITSTSVPFLVLLLK